MRVIADHLVYRNAHPNYEPVVVNGTTSCWSAAGSGPPHLLVASRCGAAKMSRVSRIALFRSDDLGGSWREVPSPFDAYLGAHQPSQSGPHLGAAGDGTTVLAACRMWVVPPGSPGWSDDAAGIVNADGLSVRAAPGGDWGPAEPHDFRRNTDEWAIPCGRAVALGGGRWVMPMERHSRPYVPGWVRKYHALVGFSVDDGATWVDHAPTLNDPDERILYYDQRMEVLGDGTLLTMAWTHDIVADRSITARAARSTDGGRTWSAPFDTGILTNGSIGPRLLADGRLIAVFARRLPPAGIRAVVSEDGGDTWGREGEFVVWDDTHRRVTGAFAPGATGGSASDDLWETMWGWTFGTPTAALLPGGRVAITYYASGDDGVPAIRCAILEA